jgi:hypothetical protein
MKLLVLTSEPVSAQQLREAVGGDVDPSDAEVLVVAPALQENPLKFWLSDADDAIARAEAVRRKTVDRLGGEGISASADTGESDPLDAVEDALATFSADRLVMFTHPADQSRYREDVDLDEVTDRFGVPVDRATVSSWQGL